MMSTPETDAYGGVDNLEVMSEAVRYTQFLVELVKTGAPFGAAAVDFGAGTGTFAARLRDHFRITCVESDGRLQRKLRALDLAVVDELAQLERGSVDYIYSLNVLEHIADDAEVARQWHALLRSSGTLFLYVPAFRVLYGPMDRKVGHLRRYRRPALCRLLESAGFEVTAAAYADSLGFPASLAAKYFGRRDGALDPAAIRFYDRRVFPLSLEIDRATRRLFGKNVWVLARKP